MQVYVSVQLYSSVQVYISVRVDSNALVYSPVQMHCCVQVYFSVIECKIVHQFSSAFSSSNFMVVSHDLYHVIKPLC